MRGNRRSILFIDPPAFCSTVEELVAPALRSRPIVIAPPGADRATVLALSLEARLAGITRGMPVRLARKHCPDLVILPPNPELYARASRALHEVLRRYAPVIEPRGYGHAFLDITGTGLLFGQPMDLAARIRRETREQMRLPLAVGAASNKLVSEAATTVVKDRAGNRVAEAGYPLYVPGGEEPGFLAPNPVRVLPGVPDPMRERLDEYQLELIGQVAALTEQQVCSVFGTPGRHLLARSRGIDHQPVLPPEVRQEFRAVHTLATDTNDLGHLHHLLRHLSERIGRRLRARSLGARRLIVDLAWTDYERARRGIALKPATLDVELYDAARRAFTIANRRPVSIRALSVSVDQFIEVGMQLDLWEAAAADDDSPAKPAPRPPVLQEAVDRIRTRWGRLGLGIHTTGRTRQGQLDEAREPCSY